MVFFTCNGCNESLKKNQVEKHLSSCRRCESVSCVDCGKDFWGTEYQAHIKCISEEEKYSGKDYKPKANSNKGEKKQEQWIIQVQAAIGKASTSPQLKSLLQRMLSYTNIPRKKAKFENFIRNSMKLYNDNLIGQLWAVLDEDKEPKAQGEKAQLEPPAVLASSTNQQKGATAVEEHTTDATGAGEEEAAPDGNAKVSKRDKKAARRMQQHKPEKKDKGQSAIDNADAGDAPENSGTIDGEKGHAEGADKRRARQTNSDIENNDAVESRKKKKRKHEPTELEDGSQDKGNKKHKASYTDEFVVCPLNATLDATEEENVRKKKYNISDACLLLIQKYGEISVKKLKKKMIADYLANSASNKFHSEEKLWATIEKKIKHNPELVLYKDRVKLRNQD